MSKSKPIVIENLGNLRLKKKLFVGLVPTNAEALIVSWYGYNSYTVSCTLPPTTHNVQVNYQSYNYDCWDASSDEDNGGIKTIKHRAPRTLMSIDYHDTPQVDVAGHTCIYAIDGKRKDRIYGSPLVLPNVYADGHICFGNVTRPADLRSSYTSFWNSPFNDLLDGAPSFAEEDATSNLDYVRRFKSLVLSESSYEDLTDEICGETFWSVPEASDGVLITNSQELLKLIPEKFWIRNSSRPPFIIAKAEKGNDTWIFTGKGYTFEVNLKQIATAQSGNKKMMQLKKKFGATIADAKNGQTLQTSEVS